MPCQIRKENYYIEYLKRSDRFPQNIYHKAKHAAVRRMFSSIIPNSLVLDAACGVGNITGKYCNEYSLVGIDEQPSAIQYCHKLYKGKYINGNLYELPFKDNLFDLILFLDAIEHFTDPVLVLRQLARVLKPQGLILICTVNYANPVWSILENTWHRFFGGSCKPYSRTVHPTRYTAELLRQHCAGLFEELSFEKSVIQMEIFYVGRKIIR